MADSVVLKELHELKRAYDQIGDEVSALAKIQRESWREDMLQEALGLLRAGLSHLEQFILRIYRHHDKPYYKRGIEMTTEEQLVDHGIAEIGKKNREIAALRALLTETIEPLWRLDDLSDGQDRDLQALIARIKAI